MNPFVSVLTGVLASSSLLLAPNVLAADKKMPTDAALIASAMKAAPARVGKDATVVVMNQDGTMRTLHAGQPGHPRPGPDVHGQKCDGMG